MNPPLWKQVLAFLFVIVIAALSMGLEPFLDSIGL